MAPWACVLVTFWLYTAMAWQEKAFVNNPWVGKLMRVVAIGGETTGWALQLESERQINDRKVQQIEVDPAPAGLPLDSLEGKRVEVVGRVEWRQGVERGPYPVLVVESIQERPNAQSQDRPPAR